MLEEYDKYMTKHHSFSKPFDIEAYNTRWFDNEPTTLSKIIPLVPLEIADPSLHALTDDTSNDEVSSPPPISTVTPNISSLLTSYTPEVYNDSGKVANITPSETADICDLPSNSTSLPPSAIRLGTINSADKLLFVCYTCNNMQLVVLIVYLLVMT